MTILIKNALYVPNSTLRLLSPQQLASQSEDNNSGFYCFKDKAVLFWDYQVKTVQCHCRNKFPTLYTIVGGNYFIALMAKAEPKLNGLANQIAKFCGINRPSYNDSSNHK